MATPKKTSNRPSRSRTETKAQLQDIQESRESIEATDAKSSEATKARAGFVRNAVIGMTVEGVIKAAADIKLATGTALDDVTSKLAAKVEELRLTEEALDLSKSELKEVHNLDVVATSIDILLEEHEEKKAQLEKEIVEARARWTDEQRVHNLDVNRRNDELKLKRERDNEAYEYSISNDRRAKEDAFSQQLLTRQREEKDRQTALERSWADREAELKLRENELVTLRTAVAGFDERIKKETDRAVAIATSSLKKDLTQEFALKEKDLNTQLTIANAQLASYIETAKKHESTIASQQAAISALQDKVVETAAKAIDGASKNDAFNQFVQMSKENGSAQLPKRGS